MMIFFVRELTRNLPALTEIELHGDRIRPHDAQATCLVTTGSDLSFALCQQSACDASSALLAKYPQVVDPLPIRDDHAYNFFIRNRNPC